MIVKVMSIISSRQGFLTLAALYLLLLAGCGQIPLGAPSASFENIQEGRASGTAPVAVGDFKLDPKLSPDVDKGLIVRSHIVSSPIDGSFAQYLKQTLITDLQAAGLYNGASQITLSGSLTESMLEVPINTSKARLGAHFVLTRKGGKTIYEKDLKVESTWPSALFGAEAIPMGINQYTSLYHKLVGKLLDDPDYRRANPK